MGFAVGQQGQLTHGPGGGFMGRGADRKGHQDFVAVQPGVMIAQIMAFQFLNGADHGGGNEGRFLFDAAQRLEGVKQHGGGGAQQGGGFAGDDSPVGQLDSQGGGPRFLGACPGGGDDGAVVVAEVHLLQK